MFDTKQHQKMIAEADLSPSNKKKLALWRKAFQRDPKTCEILRFMPSRRQFYEGNVTVTLWPGNQEWDMTTGKNRITPSDFLRIDKYGYCPRDEQEAVRLLLLSQHPDNRICLYEDRELDGEAKSANETNQRLVQENEEMKEELEALRAKVKGQEQRRP